MGLTEANAWLLHKKPISDNSFYLTFLIPQKGLLVALWRGSKKATFLQPFTPLWINLSEKFSKFYINKIEQSGASLTLNKDSLFAALYINELFFYLVKPEDDNIFWYKIYEQTLRELEKTSCQNSLEITLRSFEFKFLQELGYGINLSWDMVNQSAVTEDKYYKFIPDKGIIIAAEGFLGKHLLAIEKYDFSEKLYLKIAKKITRIALNYLLNGRCLKSRNLYLKT